MEKLSRRKALLGLAAAGAGAAVAGAAKAEGTRLHAPRGLSHGHSRQRGGGRQPAHDAGRVLPGKKPDNCSRR